MRKCSDNTNSKFDISKLQKKSFLNLYTIIQFQEQKIFTHVVEYVKLLLVIKIGEPDDLPNRVSKPLKLSES
jgi:hypothetical protein